MVDGDKEENEISVERGVEMAKLSTLELEGNSGQSYRFDVYSWDTTFKAVGAVYIVSKRYKKRNDGSYTHDILYIGQTSDLSERFSDHHKADCFNENEANAKSIHREDDESTRLEIETDLLGNRSPDCND